MESEFGEHVMVDKISVEAKLATLNNNGLMQVFDDFKDFRFWINIAQKEIDDTGNIENAMDYLKNGILHLPLNCYLVFNYACLNEKLRNFGKAMKFFELVTELNPSWPDPLLGLGIALFKLGRYSEAKLAIDKALEIEKENSEVKKNNRRSFRNDNEWPEPVQREKLLYFRALCHKRLKNYNDAKEDYQLLNREFRFHKGKVLMKLVTRLILLPMIDSKRRQIDILDQLLDYMRDHQQIGTPASDSKLYPHILKDQSLNLKHPCIYNIISDLPFFNRFSVDQLKGFMMHSKVHHYKKDDIVFLNNEVGVITQGSLHLMCHHKNIMLPDTLGKLGPGRLIGHISDEGISSMSDTWIVIHDECTEIVFFDEQIFNDIWRVQNLAAEKRIIQSNLQCNPLFNCLSQQSLNYIVNDCIQLRIYRPGELICRMSKRSKINSMYRKLIDNQDSKIKD